MNKSDKRDFVIYCTSRTGDKGIFNYTTLLKICNNGFYLAILYLDSFIIDFHSSVLKGPAGNPSLL